MTTVVCFTLGVFTTRVRLKCFLSFCMVVMVPVGATENCYKLPETNGLAGVRSTVYIADGLILCFVR